MIRNKDFGRKIFSLMFFTSLMCSNLTVFAQTPKGGKVAAKTVAAKCSGAWTGSIKYSRTQSSSNHKTVERVSARGKDTTNFEMSYNYTANVAVVDSPEQNGSSIAKASINHKMTSNETVDAVESNSCDRGKSWREMRGSSSSKTEVSGSQGGVEANVNVGVNSDGTYTVSVGVPQINGKISGSQSSTFSGQCTAKEGKSLSMPATETTLDGHSLTSDGRDHINDASPNRISGSYSLRSPGDVVETISWNLQKCGAPLRITDVTFADMKFPDWDDWKEIIEQTGTIDGNWVKVTATVINNSGETKSGELSFKETFKGDKWDGAKPDMPIKNDTVSFSVDPNDSSDVEVLWDTSGYSWYDDGRPRLVQRVKAEIWQQNKLVDDMTKNLKIAPKPIVLVHGLWSDWKQFETWQNILTTSHSYDWKAFPVGEKPEKGVLDTGGKFLSGEPGKNVSENAAQLKSYIDYAQKDRNAWHVDVVAHSTGGLIARNYINNLMPPNYGDARPQIEHLAMLGTPNAGSPCADVMYLLSGNLALYQATQDFAAGFNRMNKNRKGVKFSALAGDPLPTMCKKIEWNDGFVAVSSARSNVADSATSKSIHPDLTGTNDFSDFVKPHLAIGPKGDHNPGAPVQGSKLDLPSEQIFSPNFPENRGTSSGPSAESTGEQNEVWPVNDGKPFSKDLKLAADQVVEIDLPVEAAMNFGLTFMADTAISATLIDSGGNRAGSNLAKTTESRGWFRSIFFDKPTTAGVWKVRLENTGGDEQKVLLTSWFNAVK